MASYGILGEDNSDANMLEVIVKRLIDPKDRVKTKGFDGCGQMLTKGAKQIGLLCDLGFRRFIVSYDADGQDPKTRKQVVMEKIVWPAGVARNCCVVIPIQEIEAWILADIEAVSHVIKQWRPNPLKKNPESINKPKEHLEWLSRASNKKPRYSHATHNELVAPHLNLKTIYDRCPSFRPFHDWITEREAEISN